MQLLKIHHVAIICSNYERSKDFYVRALGLRVIREAYRKERDSYKLDLALGDAQIELFYFPHPPRRVSRPEACGLRHLAFEVQDLDKAVLLLQQNGIQSEPIRIDELTGRRFTFFSDPDDLPLELYETESR